MRNTRYGGAHSVFRSPVSTRSALSRWPRSGHAGFTLYELMVALAIAGTVMALSVGLYGLVNQERIASYVNQLLAALNLARSEAIKRGMPVTICRSLDGEQCVRGREWEKGWMIFADPNANHVREAGESLIRVQQALAGGIAITFNAGILDDSYVVYYPSGFTKKTGNFTFCDANDSDSARAIILYSTGRARVSRNSASDKALECPG